MADASRFCSLSSDPWHLIYPIRGSSVSLDMNGVVPVALDFGHL
jgi:hypothetical protein